MSRADRRAVHEELPRTTGVRPPHRYLLHLLSPPARATLRHRFDVEIHGAEQFPSAGPVVVAANHVGFVDGPMMAIFAPRPLHALTKREMFTGAMGQFLGQAGQIPVWREEVDPAAVRSALRVLRDGGAVGVFPEGTRGAGEMLRTESGAAYLALVTGASVLPLVFVGTRERGGSLNSVPPAGTHVVMQYGAPFSVGKQAWPRRQPDVRQTAEQVRAIVRELLDEALARTGMTSPGPLPENLNEQQHRKEAS
ncbi:MAG: lysophospholipid acyltransferase family protein [Marmoricola sp.]